MDAKLRVFRNQSKEENRGRKGLARRYSRELRLAAVTYLKRRKSDGATVGRAASELGVSSWSLSRWLRETESRGALVAVELSEREESTEVSLVTPRGYRVEGLSEERLVRLVERVVSKNTNELKTRVGRGVSDRRNLAWFAKGG